MIIAISGQPGCGSSTVGKILAKKLKLKHFSPGEYYKSFENGKSTESAVKFWKTEKGSSKGFHVGLDELQKKEAEKGDIVIDGKLSIRMIKNADYKIWLKAPRNVRIERYAKRDNISLEQAEKLLKEKEELERNNFHLIYGFDYFEQEREADLVVETTKTPEEIVNEIIAFINKK